MCALALHCFLKMSQVIICVKNEIIQNLFIIGSIRYDLNDSEKQSLLLKNVYWISQWSYFCKNQKTRIYLYTRIYIYTRKEKMDE